MGEHTRRVQGNLTTHEYGLDKLFMQLDESQTRHIHMMQMNSPSSRMNSASQLKIVPMLIEGELVEFLLDLTSIVGVGGR